MNQKNCIHKIYSLENTNGGVLFSAVADIGVTNYAKRDSIADAFLGKFGSFTAHEFYRTMLRDCF